MKRSLSFIISFRPTFIGDLDLEEARGWGIYMDARFTER
jgi:hypothetical protein